MNTKEPMTLKVFMNGLLKSLAIPPAIKGTNKKPNPYANISNEQGKIPNSMYGIVNTPKQSITEYQIL